MKKIMFNDQYGLTQAVLHGAKTMTRRLAIPVIESVDQVGWKKSAYKEGEIVAVAQSYLDMYQEVGIPKGNYGTHPGWRNKMFVKPDLMPHQIKITRVRCERLQDITDEDCIKEGIFEYKVGGSNERKCAYDAYLSDQTLATQWFDTPREAFAALIDKTCGKGTWNRNPWVWVYEFELVK